MISTPNTSIRSRGTLVGTTPRKVNQESATARTPEREEMLPPARRGFQQIPAEDVLRALIDRAVTAFQHGITWDRGSILNITA